MKRLRNLLIASATMALAIGAMGAPVSANSGATVAVVHGIPGVKVDVCVNGGVLQKDFKYGQRIVLDNALAAGDYRIRVKLAANARPCKGATVLKLNTTLAGSENLTIVAGFRGGKPGLRIYDHDAALGGPAKTAVSDAAIIAAHGAKTGKVDIYVAGVVVPTAPTPTVAGLGRGKAVGLGVPVSQWSAWVSAPGKISPLIGPKNKATKSGKINHYVAVGTKPSNFRLVFFRTAIDV